MKSRGFRIELREIAAHLERHEHVKEALVVEHEDAQGATRILAYAIKRDPSRADMTACADELCSHLRTVLPEYMVPSTVLFLSDFPLTPEGRLDRCALPKPDVWIGATRQYAQPQGEIEKVLATIWAEVLKVEQVGRHDNFFELGGHSLLSTKLLMRVAESFPVSPPAMSIFRCPTIMQMAELVECLLPLAPASPDSNLMDLEQGFI